MKHSEAIALSDGFAQTPKTTMKTILFLFVNILLLVNSPCFGSSRLITKRPTTPLMTAERSIAPQSQQNDFNDTKKEKTNTIAVISGIAGLLSLLFLLMTTVIGFKIGLALAFAALVMGTIAKIQIDSSRQKGWGWARLGQSLGFILPFAYVYAWLVRALFGSII